MYVLHIVWVRTSEAVLVQLLYFFKLEASSLLNHCDLSFCHGGQSTFNYWTAVV